MPKAPTSFSSMHSPMLGRGAAGGGGGGMGLGKGKTAKRHRKILRDTIKGVTRGDVRRLARRGGVKRISAMIYDDTRVVLQARLRLILQDVVKVVEHSGRKTVCLPDIVWVLNRLGSPIYGFGLAER